MAKPNINIIMTALKAKEADASRVLQSRDAIIIEKSADELDEIEGAVAREIAIRNLDRESGLLREIRSALRRIDAGTFGMCLHCEKEIGRRRLEAVPWARRCLQCQEAADRGDYRVLETEQVRLAEAA
jgi:RNA polymerase-binding transcription factor